MSRSFTDQELSIARETHLPTFLAHLGYTVKPIGRFHTLAEMDSFRIRNGRTWKRYSENVGGDAITFLQHFDGKTFPEAVNHLLEYHGYSRSEPTRPLSPRVPLPVAQPKEKGEFILPEKNGDNRRVFAYLRKRGIDPKVIRGFLEAGLLYESREKHNCVFVGRTSEGKPAFASQRGTYDFGGRSFRGDVTNSDKSVGFSLWCKPENPAVFVFEAPIDMMSYLSLDLSLHSNAVALCGVHEGALDRYLKENPTLKFVTLCLDNDKAGQEATQRLTEKYTAQGYTILTDTPQIGKDWNDVLLSTKNQKEVVR